MNMHQKRSTGTARAGHLLQSIARLLEAGQITPDEAAKLRADLADGNQDQVVQIVRTKHAEAAMASAISDGNLTQQEADGYLRQIRDGDHSSALRARLRGFRRKGVPPAKASDS